MTNTIIKQTTADTPLARRRGRPLGSTNAAKKAAMVAAAQEAQQTVPSQDDYQLTPGSLGKTAATIAAQTPPPAEDTAVQRKPAARRAIGFKAAKFNTAPAKSWNQPAQNTFPNGEQPSDAQPKTNRGYDNPPIKYNQNKRDNYNKEGHRPARIPAGISAVCSAPRRRCRTFPRDGAPALVAVLLDVQLGL